MSAYVCTVAGRKGGVGKTTTAVNLGVAFSRAGYDVVVVDADLEMSDLAEIVDFDVEDTVHDILAGDTTVSEALTGATDGLAVVPGDPTLEGYAKADPENLSKVISTLETTQDVVIVDTGPGLSHETTIPIEQSDGVLLTLTPDRVAINDARKTGELTEQVDGTVIGGWLTQVDDLPEIEAIEAELTHPVLGIDPLDERSMATEPVTHEFPDSARAAAFDRLVETLEKVFFDGVDPFAVEKAYQKSWVRGETSIEDDEDEDDDDDYNHAVFQGI